MECVVLAAGEGRRMRPLTSNRPKVMLPLANRPILEHLIIAARDAGIAEFTLVVGYREREVRSCFGNGERLGVRIRYVPQRHQLGTGDALKACEGLVSGPFLLLNGDMVTGSVGYPGPCRPSSPRYRCLTFRPCPGLRDREDGGKQDRGSRREGPEP